MHNRAKPYFLAALPAAPYLVGVGLQVSGRTHAGLAFLAFEIAAMIAAGVAWSYWTDWRQAALAGGYSNGLVRYALAWPGFKLPKLFTIRPELIVAILTLLLCNTAIGAFFELTEGPHRMGAQANRWEPLSPDETLALRKDWRAISAEHLGVLCAIPSCSDLAESIYDVAKGLDWPAIYASTYFSDDGIHPGIEIWSYSGKAEIRDKIANSLEHATNGRLKISSHEWPWQGDQPINPSMGRTINLVVGRLR